jgi:hypothetical protein
MEWTTCIWERVDANLNGLCTEPWGLVTAETEKCCYLIFAPYSKRTVTQSDTVTHRQTRRSRGTRKNFLMSHDRASALRLDFSWHQLNRQRTEKYAWCLDLKLALFRKLGIVGASIMAFRITAQIKKALLETSVPSATAHQSHQISTCLTCKYLFATPHMIFLSTQKIDSR